jgi:dipeptidyl aminopeptidase/acylaminoacyl peptidase
MVYRANGDYVPAGWTNSGRLLLGHIVSHTRSTVSVLNPADGASQPLLKARPDAMRLGGTVRSPDVDDVTFLLADLDGEFTGVHSVDHASGETTALTSKLAWDVVDMEALADKRTLALLINEDARYSLYLLDIQSRNLRRVDAPAPGFLLRINAHPTIPLLAVDVMGDDGIRGVWTYDLNANRFEPWSVANSGNARPTPDLIRYPTFDRVDGSPRTVPAVVSRPAKRNSSRSPVVIEIHGGPAMQSLALVAPPDPVILSDVAIIRPNVRGSSGYGTRYEALDDREHREEAVRDIGALLDWIATQPDLDSERVMVMGGSYGGYMTLATLVHYSNRLRCGFDMFGISDLPAFLEESEKGHYPEAQRGEFGDARDPAVRQFLHSISPAAHAEDIRVPLMIYQGMNDVRVKPEQSRAMVQRIRKAGGRVIYVEAPNEGHGLNQPVTQFYVGLAGLEFTERCLSR